MKYAIGWFSRTTRSPSVVSRRVFGLHRREPSVPIHQCQVPVGHPCARLLPRLERGVDAQLDVPAADRQIGIDRCGPRPHTRARRTIDEQLAPEAADDGEVQRGDDQSGAQR